MLPMASLSQKGRLVYLLRNPKDTLTSFHFYYQKLAEKQSKSPEFKLRAKAGWTGHASVIGSHGTYGDFNSWPPEKCNMMYGSYYAHVQEMDQVVERLGRRAICVYYDALHEDFPTEMQRLARFLDVPLSKRKLAAIARYVSLDAMAARTPSLTAGETVRKGRVGDHREHLTPVHWRDMDEVFEQRLGSVGIAQPLRQWL